jgi:hypothetical protein
MGFPLLGMLGRGGLELLKYAGAIGVPGITFGLLAQPKEYERNFNYDYYEKDHPRFYSPIWASEDNPSGFNEEMYNEAREEYYRLRPMY